MKQLSISTLLVAMMIIIPGFMRAQVNVTICNGDSIDLDLTGTYTGTIQWQSSPDGITWTSIPGATTDPYTISSVPTDIYFQAILTSGTCAPIASSLVHVMVNPAITVDAGSTATICSGSSATIGGAPTANGGTGPYTYSWSPAGSLSSSTVGNPVASPTSTTTYTVTVTDSLGCTATGTVTVMVNANPVANAGNDNMYVCFGSSVTIGGAPTASGGTGPYTYMWAPGGSLSSTTLANPLATPSGMVDYMVMVTDANGCMDMDTVTLSTVSIPTANAGADFSVNCDNSTTVLSASAANGTLPYTYNWSPGTNLSATNITNPTFSTSFGGMYEYVFTVTDSNGCMAMDTLIATVVASGTVTFNYTGSMQTFTVPNCGSIDSVFIQVWGGQGANGAQGDGTSPGGSGALGGYAEGWMVVTPGQTLNVFVGGQASGSTGGFNGGANGGNANAGGGGGASDVRVNGVALTDRVITAGGGGGGGRGGCETGGVNGGNGGAGGGGNGSNGTNSPDGGAGFGAVGSAAGGAGVGCSGFLGQNGSVGTSGTGGTGGGGQACCCFSVPSVPGGGGGGGGFTGGGGGGGGSAGTTGCSGNNKGGGGGGAGGTSNTSGVTNGSTNNGIWLGNGMVSISYQ